MGGRVLEGRKTPVWLHKAHIGRVMESRLWNHTGAQIDPPLCDVFNRRKKGKSQNVYPTLCLWLFAIGWKNISFISMPRVAQGASWPRFHLISTCDRLIWLHDGVLPGMSRKKENRLWLNHTDNVLWVEGGRMKPELQTVFSVIDHRLQAGAGDIINMTSVYWTGLVKHNSIKY